MMSTAMQASDDNRNRSFLAKRVGLLMFGVVFVSLILNTYTSVIHFLRGSLFLAALSLLAVAVLPKAVFGLILFLGRKNNRVWLSVPMGWRHIFPRTFARGREEEGALDLLADPWIVQKNLLRHLLWLTLGLIPVAALTIYRP